MIQKADKSFVTGLSFELDITEPVEFLKSERHLTLVNVGNAAAKAFLISRILESFECRNVLWASTDEKAEQLVLAGSMFFPGKVHLVPAELSFRDYYRLREQLGKHEKDLFLFEDFAATSAQALPSESEIKSAQVDIRTGDQLFPYTFFEQLEGLGYDPAQDIFLLPGEFVRRGENIFVYPINGSECLRIQLDGDRIECIESWDQHNKKPTSVLRDCALFPAKYPNASGRFLEHINGGNHSLFLSDDLDQDLEPEGDFCHLTFTTFPREGERFFHLNFFSVLPFYTIQDFVVDMKERMRRDFEIVILTKKFEELQRIFRDNDLMYTEDLSDKTPSTLKVIACAEDAFVPHSFQNNERKLLFLTDREIFQFHRSSRQKKALSGMNLDLMTSLKPGDYVVHLDHGLARFEGVVRRDLGREFGTREYLKLSYAENDKLFVPVESAEKVTKFIGDDDPRLTRLGSSEWKNAQNRIKKETQRIAGELLKFYASREMAKSKGKAFAPDDEMMKDFCAGFPYDMTPGQAQAWEDVRIDMERGRAMDRLVCGDVGFGKTEIAMRAAFKAFRSGVQTAFLAPITILAEQHYQTFLKRIHEKDYGIRIELLSRFQTAAEQKAILKDIELGLVDVVIGTHRLLSEDMKFKKLGLLVIDEEQRFGVQQKEKLKKLRANVDILTLTATPIPRTLNMSLNKLKDISTIATPPPGRLPVVTEVRKYNLNLIRERILLEMERGGQVYFLHNQVKTIESQASQLKALVPEAEFIVAHGQLSPQELEDRIRRFKEGEAHVLVASTIIENGIDLSNANTLLVNRADQFGLAQLYQLRGRVGRSRTQAYSYFLYQGQKLDLEAKKRLRAIVEASELGAGFQIAMRDLEIRGAGEVLGVNQSGTIKTVGVSHFIRMLHKTIEEMKSGEVSSGDMQEEAISVEVPLSAFIPEHYIPNTNEKIQLYKELASAESPEQLEDLQKDLREDYGALPVEVQNLCKVIALKMLLREANIGGIKIHKSTHKNFEVVLRMGGAFTPDQVFGLIQHSKHKWVVTATALKLSLEKLPMDWYDQMCGEIRLLLPQKKSQKKSKK